MDTKRSLLLNAKYSSCTYNATYIVLIITIFCEVPVVSSVSTTAFSKPSSPRIMGGGRGRGFSLMVNVGSPALANGIVPGKEALHVGSLRA